MWVSKKWEAEVMDAGRSQNVEGSYSSQFVLCAYPSLTVSPEQRS